jgi:Helicase conserved C-terminal domain
MASAPRSAKTEAPRQVVLRCRFAPVLTYRRGPAYDARNPLIVQSDRSVLVEVENPLYGEARDALAPFAELEKSPEHIHTYRISDLSLWNAAASAP